MNFKHMFTKLVINVTKEIEANISSITLKGSIPTATLDLSALTVTADANASATSIVAQAVKANETYRAIIVPQTVALTLEVATSDGKTLSQKLTSTTLAQGGQYSVNIRVLPDDIEVKLSGDIENWTDEGETDGPMEPYEIRCKEMGKDGTWLYRNSVLPLSPAGHSHYAVQEHQDSAITTK